MKAIKSPYVKIGGGNKTPGKMTETGAEGRPSNFTARAQSAMTTGIGETPQKISDLVDLYQQLNRVVENLVVRIADQERRLNKVTQSGIVMEHYGRRDDNERDPPPTKTDYITRKYGRHTMTSSRLRKPKSAS